MPDVKPRPPEELVGALHDRAHTDGKLIAATPVRGERTTMTPDLTALADELERLEKQATEGPWCWDNRGEKGDDIQLGSACLEDGKPLVGHFDDEGAIYVDHVAEIHGGPGDASLICMLRNAAPQLIEALRERAELKSRLRQAEGHIRELMKVIGWGANPSLGDKAGAVKRTQSTGDTGWIRDVTGDARAFLASPPKPKEAE